MLEAQQESAYSLDAKEDVLRKLRERAAAVGCDAVVLSGDHNSAGHVYTLDGGMTTTLKGYRAACVVYTVGATSRE
jgi:hypothetical protein